MTQSMNNHKETQRPTQRSDNELVVSMDEESNYECSTSYAIMEEEEVQEIHNVQVHVAMSSASQHRGVLPHSPVAARPKSPVESLTPESVAAIVSGSQD